MVLGIFRFYNFQTSEFAWQIIVQLMHSMIFKQLTVSILSRISVPYESDAYVDVSITIVSV